MPVRNLLSIRLNDQTTCALDLVNLRDNASSTDVMPQGDSLRT